MLILNTNRETDRALDIANILFKDKPKLITSLMKVHQSWASHYTEDMDIIDSLPNT